MPPYLCTCMKDCRPLDKSVHKCSYISNNNRLNEKKKYKFTLIKCLTDLWSGWSLFISC